VFHNLRLDTVLPWCIRGKGPLLFFYQRIALFHMQGIGAAKNSPSIRNATSWMALKALPWF
jgi:hypothetical protein